MCFPTEVKQYLPTKFDLGERTGIKSNPAKMAADMRTARNPDSSRMFERKHWLTKGQVRDFFLACGLAKKQSTSRSAQWRRTGGTGRAREMNRPGRGGHPPWS